MCRLDREVSKLSNYEREKLKDMIRAMSKEELEIVVENIPIELCVERVQKDCFN